MDYINSAALQSLFPQIRNIEPIATGGFKAVYRIQIDNRIEALKVIEIPEIPEHISQSEREGYRSEAIGRIQREIEILKKCKLPEIVKLGQLEPKTYKVDSKDLVIYSEEFLSGSDLGKLILERGPKPDEYELKLLFVSLLKAIRELWGHGYVHRDIKPLNIIKLPSENRPFVLLDLGIAFSVYDTALTFNPQNRLPIATYRYLAPEMLNANFRANLDYRSDLYTAGLTVFEYAAQHHALARNQDDLMRTVTRVLNEQPKRLASLRPDITLEFCQLVDQMLRKKPALRPANLNGLINSLEGDV